MTHRSSFWVKIAASIGAFFVLKILLSYVALSSFSAIVIDAEFDHDDLIDVYFSSGINSTGFRAEYTKRSKSYEEDDRAALPVYLNDHVARKIRLDTGLEPGEVKLYSLKLGSHFGPDITFNSKSIYEQFTPNEDISVFKLLDDHVLIRSEGTDPFITYDGELILDNFFLEYLLPLILAALFFVLMSNLSLKSFPAFADINTKTSSTGVNFDALDGIRGLAALLVLGQHSGVMKGGGIFGVWLFFCLSGFLLTTSFVNRPERAVSFSYMGSYITRRVKRIVPMYYTMITVTILFLGKFDSAIRHYLFLQADGHYWTVAQEMFFYLLLPILMATNFVFFRTNRLLSLLFFGAVAYLAHRYITIDVVPLFGNNVTVRPMIGIFLVGVAMAFLYGWVQTAFTENSENKLTRQLCAWLGALLLVGSIAVSAHLVKGLGHIDATTRPGWFGLAGGLVIFLTLMARNTAFDRVLKFIPLRAVGLVGFSFYLLHPMMISVVRGTTMYFGNYYPIELTLFISAGLLTYAFAALTYSYIERPFIRSSKAGQGRDHDNRPKPNEESAQTVKPVIKN